MWEFPRIRGTEHGPKQTTILHLRTPKQEPPVYRTYHFKEYPEGPSTQYSRTLVPKAIKGMVFGTRVLTYWALGPSGIARLATEVKAGGRPRRGQEDPSLVEAGGLRGVRRQWRFFTECMDACMCPSFYVCIYVGMCVFAYIYTLICSYVCSYMYIYIYTYAYLYMYTYICMCICTCSCVYIYNAYIHAFVGSCRLVFSGL